MKLSTGVLHKLNLGVIYLLLEPNKGVVRYVGQTTRNPRERFTAHMSKRQTIHKGNWISSLRRKGQRPRMLVYKIVPVCELDAAEIEAISWFRRCGCNLVNYLDGGGSLSEADRQKISARQQGENNSRAKLTDKQVLT